MTTFTLAKLNKVIRTQGVECVKGSGYFWFAALDDSLDDVPASVYTNRFSDMTEVQWMEHVTA